MREDSTPRKLRAHLHGHDDLASIVADLAMDLGRQLARTPTVPWRQQLAEAIADPTIAARIESAEGMERSDQAEYSAEVAFALGVTLHPHAAGGYPAWIRAALRLLEIDVDNLTVYEGG